MTTAFVLSGGGSLGAVQVGMLQALAAHGVEPDLLVGTSAGAMNAAWVAAHGTSADSLSALAGVWIRLRRRDVFPVRVRTALRGLLGLGPAVTSPDRLRELVAACAGIDLVEEARIPVHLVAADLLSGLTVTVSGGSLVDGVLASAAIPGVFPPVLRDGRLLVDGGVAHHTGVSRAVELGATDIYVLPTGAPCALPAAPRSALGTALHALTLLIEQRTAAEMAHLAGTASIKLLPPLCPLRTSAMDFGHAAELIDRSRKASMSWIDRGDIDLPGPEAFLAAHRHRSSVVGQSTRSESASRISSRPQMNSSPKS
ncbi:MAG TPA: patatin-like phospholipase family protein [Marmoricola sp.]|nr:patatin-like phospholipase family protein [Marmoricola sp.]